MAKMNLEMMLGQVSRAFLQVQSCLLFLVLIVIHIVCFVWDTSKDLMTSVGIVTQSWLQPEPLPDYQQVRTDFARLTKAPRHLAVVVSEQDATWAWQHLARIVSWSLAGGVKCVSLFDRAGRFKKDKLVLEKAMAEVMFEEIDSSEIAWHEHPSDNDSVTSEEASDKRTRYDLCLLSEEDGKDDLAKTARVMADKVSAGEMEVQSIDEKAVSDSVNTCRGLPDPDLLLLFGPKHLGAGGYPPWQVRLTEFHRLPAHRRSNYSDFIRVLRLYSKCEQRLGK